MTGGGNDEKIRCCCIGEKMKMKKRFIAVGFAAVFGASGRGKP
jgi:hypothetical protein